MTSISYSGRSFKWNTAEDIKEVVIEIEKCSDLFSLDLSGNTICLEAAELVAKSLETKKSLKKLYLNDLFTGRGMDVIKPALISIFSALKESKAELLEINLSDNALGVKGIEALETLLLNPCGFNLQTIKLNNLGIGIFGATNLSRIINSWVDFTDDQNVRIKLTSFECGRNRLEDKGAEILSESLKRIKTLESFEIYQNGIKYQGALALIEVLENNPNIKNLNLNDNLIVEAGATVLAKTIGKMNKLETLNIGDCLIRNKGVEALINSLKYCKSLKHLDIGFNEITIEKGIHILETVLSHLDLNQLILDGNLFGEEGCNKIQNIYNAHAKHQSLGLSLEDDEGEPEDECDQEDINEIKNEKLDSGELFDKMEGLKLE